jgi:ribonuclease HII
MRTAPDLQEENHLWQEGFLHIAGLDEAGRGAWAGPVAAGAVIIPHDSQILNQLHGVRDSKQMTPAQRNFWAVEIKKMVLCWGVGMASQQEIDQIGILPATRLAMKRALDQLTLFPTHLLIDALRLPDESVAQTALIKGDVRSLSIAAASVLAKTTRDAFMAACDSQYPGYHFAQHKGYGTRKHQAALEKLGPCPLHRFSFAPIQNCLGQH